MSETIGERIAAARKKQGMTQEQLAAALNVSRAAVSNWEKGRRLPDAEMIVRISKLLDTDLINGDTNEAPAGDPETPETREAPENAETAPAQSGKALSARNRWIILAVVAAVIAGILLWVLPTPGKPQYKAEGGKTYTMEQLKEGVPAQEGRPHLRIDLEKISAAEYLMYAFQCYEVNGFPLDVQRADIIYFKKDGTAPVEYYSAEGLSQAGMDMHIPANGSWTFDGGMLEEETRKAYGVGLILHATDENGEELTFTAYLPFEN